MFWETHWNGVKGFGTKHEALTFIFKFPDGTIEYANPSHIEKLFEVYARNHEITVEQAKQKFVADFDFFDNLMKDTAVMLVWYEYEKHLVIPTKEQRESLQLLIDNGCVSKDIQTYV